MWYTWNILGYLRMWKLCTEKCLVKVEFGTQIVDVSSGVARFFGAWGNSQWLFVVEVVNFKQITIINWITMYLVQLFKSCWVQSLPTYLYVAPLRLCCLGWPHYWPPLSSYTPGCWYYKTEKMIITASIIHARNIFWERERTHIYFFFKSRLTDSSGPVV